MLSCGAMVSVEEFLERSGFHRRLERWIYEKDIGAALYDAGFDLVRMKKVPEVHLMAVTGKTAMYREAQFTEGPINRVQNAMRERGLVCHEDYTSLSAHNGNLIIVLGVKLPDDQ